MKESGQWADVKETRQVGPYTAINRMMYARWLAMR